MNLDYVQNGRAFGNVASTMLATGFDPGALRPYMDEEDRPCISIMNKGKRRKLVVNAPATLRRDEWKLFDDAILRAARPRLRAFGDLRAANSYNIPNAMGKTVLEYQTMGDITPATISMDGLRISEYDRPTFDIGNLPLPIIHKDFQFSSRQLAVSRNGGAALDTTMAELAGRRVAEEAEKLLLGVTSSYSYAGATIYGYTNHPDRITKTDITDPTTTWEPKTLITELLTMIQLLNDAFFYGPFVVYFSPAWNLYLDDDYSGTGANFSDITLRQRINNIDAISAVRTLEYLTGFQILVVQMTPDVARAVVGMDITTVQWESQGGFQFNFKVMAILVPQIRANFDGNTGIAHGTTS